MHGVLGPPTRSFRATVTAVKATFYNGYGTPKGVTNIQEVVKWLTTERF